MSTACGHCGAMLACTMLGKCRYSATEAEWRTLLAANPTMSLMVPKAIVDSLTTPKEPTKWSHGCNSLCVNIDLWLDRCPHCGMPRPSDAAPKSSPPPAMKTLLGEIPECGGCHDKHTCIGALYQRAVDLKAALRALLAAPIAPAVEQEKSEREQALVRALKLIEHATKPTPDDGSAHENAYTIAHQALSVYKWGVA